MLADLNYRKIFVAIASYRDPECQWTIKDLFASAAKPDRVFVGVCWQFDPVQDSYCFTEPCPRPEQMRVVEFLPEQVQGACWAKAQALALARDEEFILLIDSHMRFAAGWDEEILQMLASTENPKAFLSTYPAGYVPPDERRFSTPRLAPIAFKRRVPAQNSVLLDMPKPFLSGLVAGGYLFGPRVMFEEVPYDPYIYFLGEEIAHAARYFTHGWDGYTPNRCLIHHYYTRKEAPKHWGDQKSTYSRNNEASYKRVRHLLEIERTSDVVALMDFERFGLGRARPLEAFEAQVGIELKSQLFDRERHKTVSAVEESVRSPRLPQSQSEVAHVRIQSSAVGQIMVPVNDAYIGKSFRELGEWTAGINRLIARWIPPGGQWVEVGAGFGGRTLALSRLVGSDGFLWAIEPSRTLSGLCQASCVLNGMENVRVLQNALGKQVDWVRVSEPDLSAEGNFGLISIRRVVSEKTQEDLRESLTENPDEGPQQGPQTAAQRFKRNSTGMLPDLRAVLSLPFDEMRIQGIRFLLIDAPGAAGDILAGARNTLARDRPALLVNVDRAEDRKHVTERIGSLGYELWKYSCPFFVADNYWKCTSNPFGALASQVMIANPTPGAIDPLMAEFSKSVTPIAPKNQEISR